LAISVITDLVNIAGASPFNLTPQLPSVDYR